MSEGKRKRVDKAEKKPAKKGRKKTKATKDKGSDAGSEDGDSKYPEFDDILSQRRTKRPRVAGQLDNCAICEKRFTVTGYTKAGPQGGLLCPKCSKDVDKSDETKKPTKTKVRNRHKKRQLRSDMLDGRHKRGARSLVDVCIQVRSSLVDRHLDGYMWNLCQFHRRMDCVFSGSEWAQLLFAWWFLIMSTSAND